MERFGVDKPDLRFGMELVELTDVFAGTEFKAFASAASIKAINVKGAAADYGRNQLDKLTERAKSLGAKGLVWLKATADRTFDSPVAKFLSPDEVEAVTERLGAADGDLVLIVADEWATTCEVLGQLRNDLGRPPVWEGQPRYVWVVDFPMFVGVDAETGRPKPAHHPFTRPHPDDVDLLETDPMNVRSQAYDLVLNGWELGSGSIRIHETELQRRIFELIGFSAEDADRKFGFFLNPFEYGAPPHGGFAFGIDRLVAILAGEENIREVIAFPKTQSGADPMTNSPSPVAQSQLDQLGDPRARLALDGAGHPLSEVALEDEVDDRHRQRHQHGPHHDRVPRLALPEGALELGQPDRQRAQLVAVGGDQRMDELVPRTDRGEDRQGDHRRAGDREDDLGERRPPTGAVDRRGLLDLDGDLLHELLHHEDAHGVDHDRQDQPGVRVDHARAP